MNAKGCKYLIVEPSEGTIYLQRRKEIGTHHRSGRCSGIWTDIEFVQKQMIEDKIYSKCYRLG